MSTWPASGRSSPAITRRSVDLPLPLGPSSAVSEPSGIASETASSAVKPLNCLLTSTTEMPTSVLLWLEDAQRDHDCDRDQRQHHGRRVGPGGVEAVELGLDEQRQRLRLALDVAGDGADRAELADRAGGGQHDAVGDGRADRRKGDA